MTDSNDNQATPRTDAIIRIPTIYSSGEAICVALINLSTALERELNIKTAELEAVNNMLILCGEEEAVAEKSCAHKLRAIIDKNIQLRDENEVLREQNFAMNETIEKMVARLQEVTRHGYPLGPK